MKEEDEGTSVSANAFAGASVEYSLKGAVQWLKPTPPPSVDSIVIPKTTGTFTDFATIGASISGLAGIGAGLNSYVHLLMVNSALRLPPACVVELEQKAHFFVRLEESFTGVW